MNIPDSSIEQISLNTVDVSTTNSIINTNKNVNILSTGITQTSPDTEKVLNSNNNPRTNLNLNISNFSEYRIYFKYY